MSPRKNPGSMLPLRTTTTCAQVGSTRQRRKLSASPVLGGKSKLLGRVPLGCTRHHGACGALGKLQTCAPTGDSLPVVSISVFHIMRADVMIRPRLTACMRSCRLFIFDISSTTWFMSSIRSTCSWGSGSCVDGCQGHFAL